MRGLVSLLSAFRLFSRIPLPLGPWKPAHLRLAMAGLPLVGLVIGGAVWAWMAAGQALGASAWLVALGPVALPLLITGGIHFDGLMDVADAQASCTDAERRRAIMKDPHVGAFAVMAAGLYLIAQFALSAQLVELQAAGPLLCLAFVLSRCSTALAVLFLPRAVDAGMLADQQRQAAAAARPVAIALSVATAGTTVVLHPLAGAALVAVTATLLASLGPFSRRSFGGMTGDVAGFHLQATELALMACLCALGLGGLL
ncbi:adenosylcobinamide-GDP ribazoletransferase [Eggerthellaceae bacterium zg-1084]|uniref:adenosylcobinamide-GDP ribazoletransferase n=1 Tax=Berryella wangjianweii TaxID=2734634 RepID=UPI001555CB62|nr:adenosylcobinamide-GDP ribazoletransferase [Berryella wangjianweii]NPD31327.1 adenosylcobinamide-GDP ribazoletransferase [Berryella wangjianweii]